MVEPTILLDDTVVRAGSWCGVLLEVWKSPADPRRFRELCKIELEYV